MGETLHLWTPRQRNSEFTSIKRTVLSNAETEIRISGSSIQFGDENGWFPVRCNFGTEVTLSSHKHPLRKESCTGDQAQDLDLLHTEMMSLTHRDWVPHNFFFSRMLMGRRRAQMRNWYLQKACAIGTAPKLVGVHEEYRKRPRSLQKKRISITCSWLPMRRCQGT